MVAVDSSSLIAHIQDESADDVTLIDKAIEENTLVVPPVVIAEIFSAKSLSENTRKLLEITPQLPIKHGYWQRVGEARAKLLSQGKKARLADSLIAVNCLDNETPLITRDGDFRHYAKAFGLEILPKKK